MMFLLFVYIVLGLLPLMMAKQIRTFSYKKIFYYLGLYLIVLGVLAIKLWLFIIMLLIVLPIYKHVFFSNNAQRNEQDVDDL